MTVMVAPLILLHMAGGGLGAPFQSCEVQRYVRTSTIGADDSEAAYIVRTDSAGRIVTAGRFGREGIRSGYSVDFDPTDGVDEHTIVGRVDPFVMVTNADGSYAWTNTFGGAGDEYVNDLAIDQQGQTWVVGSFGQMFSSDPVYVDFDPGPGEDIHVCPPDSHCSFVATYDPSGAYIGTYSNGDSGGVITAQNIAFDGIGNRFVTGFFQKGTYDLNPRRGEDVHTAGDDTVRYITKFLANGRYAWSVTLPALLRDLDVDSDGNLYLSGKFNSYRRYDFDPGPGEDFRGGAREGEDRGYEVFVTRINADRSYGWTRMVAVDHDIGDVVVEDLEVDGDSVYLAGYFRDYIEFDPDGSPDRRTDDHAAWLVKLDRGGRFQWTHVLAGDDGSSTGKSVSADGRGGVYFAGTFGDYINFDPDGDGDVLYGPGSTATFVSKLGSDKTYHWTGVAGGQGWTDFQALQAASDGRILFAGHFTSRGTDFDPTEGEDIRRDNGAGDAFVTTWLCSDCDALLSHGLWVKARGAIVSRVNTNLSAGRVELRLTSDDGGVDRTATVRLHPDGRARARFDELPPGRYDVQIQWIDDASVARLCDGPLMKRSAVVR